MIRNFNYKEKAMKIISIYAWVFTLLAFSCGPRERIPKEAFEEVNKNMEIKRISEVEILESAMEWGDSLTTKAQKNLIENLQQAIADGGFGEAIKFCKTNAKELENELSGNEEILIRRVSSKHRNPNNAPTEEEAMILEAYAYNSEQGLESDPNIQKLEDGEVFLYTKAIIFPGGLCNNCHGKPEVDISKSTLEVISSNYPEDMATGFRKGDLRGMWSVRIPKKEVVKRL